MRLKTKGEERYNRDREEWSKIDKSLWHVKGSSDKKDPKQVEASLEMQLHAWLWSLIDNRKLLGGFLVSQCHDQRNALGPQSAGYLHNGWKMQESTDTKITKSLK